MTKYDRLTIQVLEDIDLKKELGYSHIYKRLHELEDKIENGELVNIVWHDAKKELPKRNKYVLGYCASDNTYAVVKWDYADWSDDNDLCYNVDYWTELPKFNK